MNDLAAVVGKEADVLFVHDHTVKCDESFIQQTDVTEKCGSPFPQFRPQLFRLGLVLQKVGGQRNIVSNGQRLGCFQKFPRTRVERVRFDHDVDERIAVPFPDKVLRVGQPFCRRLVAGGGKIKKHFPQQAAHA